MNNRVEGSKWCNSGLSIWLEMAIFYHLLWFWDGGYLPTASFRQKLFLVVAKGARFWARLVSAVHGDSWSYRMGSTANAGR
jgi:hypothetical protein